MAKQLRYIGFSAQGVEVGEGDWYGYFPHGEVVEVPDDIAGRPPSGAPGEEKYDPGTGLLAQVGNFELVKQTKTKESHDG